MKLLIFLVASQLKGISLHGPAMFDAGDDVGTADPVGFGEIGRRPVGAMIGVRVVEPDDVQLRLARLALNAEQLARIDVIAVVGRVCAGVAAEHDGADILNSFAVDYAQQHAAALVRISLFAMTAKLIELRFADLQHSVANDNLRTEQTTVRIAHQGFDRTLRGSKLFPESLAQVLVGGVGKDGHNHSVRACAARDAEAAGHGRPGGDADQQPFFPRQALHHAIGIFGADSEVALGDAGGREVSLDEVKAKLQEGEQFVLIDVREESEFAL